MTGRLLEIPGTVPYEQTGWQLLVLKTPAQTMNAFLRNGDPPLVFGCKGDIEGPATAHALAAFGAISDLDRRADYCTSAVTFASFDDCGFVSGPNRQFLRGISEDEDLLQVIPLYACERSEAGGMPPMGTFRRWTNLLDMGRAPQPWFQCRMKGMRSGLSVAKWGMEKMSTFEGFVRILSEDAGAWLEVRNRLDSLLTFPNDDGWNQALSKVRAHVGITPAYAARC